MKAWWTLLTARIDSLSLRERLFLLLAVLFVSLALADSLWLAPAQAQHSALTKQHAANDVELNRLRAELATMGTPTDVNATARADLQATELQLVKLEKDIRDVAPMSKNGPPLEHVLVQFLRRQPGLVLLSTSTLESPAQSMQPTLMQTLVQKSMSKRGLELRVAGSYASLTRYVQSLENALPHLRWGALLLQKNDPQQAELTLQVFVVGVQP
jgi:MSHA biogenesis protein MshJ